jgi:hypothetical protein
MICHHIKFQRPSSNDSLNTLTKLKAKHVSCSGSAVDLNVTRKLLQEIITTRIEYFFKIYYYTSFPDLTGSFHIETKKIKLSTMSKIFVIFILQVDTPEVKVSLQFKFFIETKSLDTV